MDKYNEARNIMESLSEKDETVNGYLSVEQDIKDFVKNNTDFIISPDIEKLFDFLPNNAIYIWLESFCGDYEDVEEFFNENFESDLGSMGDEYIKGILNSMNEQDLLSTLEIMLVNKETAFQVISNKEIFLKVISAKDFLDKVISYGQEEVLMNELLSLGNYEHFKIFKNLLYSDEYKKVLDSANTRELFKSLFLSRDYM